MMDVKPLGHDHVRAKHADGSTVHHAGLIIISSPSGAGKTTLTRRLLAVDERLALSISATTRAPRPGEINGLHYFFTNRQRFEAERDAGGFLEHAVVFDNLYGTPRAPVQAWLDRGKDVVFDIDWQGARQLTRNAIAPATTIFILPPSMAALKSRLRARAGDDEAVIARRMARAHDEISHWDEYDFVVINDDLDVAERALRDIIASVRSGGSPDAVSQHRRATQSRFADHVRDLMAERA